MSLLFLLGCLKTQRKVYDSTEVTVFVFIIDGYAI